MTHHEFTPQESLRLISRIIEEARERFEANGIVYVFWGVLIALATLSQYALIQAGYARISWYPYLIIPIGFIFNYWYFRRKQKTLPHNPIAQTTAVLWTILGVDMIILGFLFAAELKEHLLPVLLLLQGIGMIVSGSLIKSRLLTAAGFVLNLGGFLAFMIDWQMQPLLAGILAILCIVLPGILLTKKERRHV